MILFRIQPVRDSSRKPREKQLISSPIPEAHRLSVWQFLPQGPQDWNGVPPALYTHLSQRQKFQQLFLKLEELT